jgi:phospholipase/carboxylesterase
LPLVVLLHGAGHSADELMGPHRDQLQALGIDAVLLAVDSRSGTWDGVRGGFGPDVRFIDKALNRVFSQVAVDPARIALTGFSDGATSAIGLGRANGDLFGKVTCYAPGFLLTIEPIGKPRFFITHGTQDPILSIETTRQVIVPGLRAAGYEVEYHEWTGGHGVSAELLRQATAWMTS